MHFSSAAVLAALVATVAAKDGRTFAVNRFYGSDPLLTARMDPIVNPGVPSGHVHAIHGGSNFALDMTDTALLDSQCTSSIVNNDKSNYWTPQMYFVDQNNGSFHSVPMFYMNVYYFFDATDDKIVAFPPGLRIFTGDPTLRTPPSIGGKNNIDLANGPAQPVQMICPRMTNNGPTYPLDSDGLHGVGIAETPGGGSGSGFPQVDCDGYASPLRADIHFPSCYNPAVGLRDYKNNMQYPSSKGTTGGKVNCPAGWIHVPHLFYEVYWNTPLFKDSWVQGQGKQPFVLSNGDPTGYSLHGDFISGWDVATLQQVIDNCDAGTAGMDKCPGLLGDLNWGKPACTIPSEVKEQVFGVMDILPGGNTLGKWGVNAAAATPASGTSVAVAAPSTTAKASSTSAPAAAATKPATSPAAAAVSTPVTKPVTKPAAVNTPAPKPVTTLVTSVAPYPVDDDEVVVTVTMTVTTYVDGPSPTSTASNVAGWTALGCWSDDLSARVLSGATMVPVGNNAVTSTGCIAACESKGFTMAGTEYGQECYCGNSLVGSTQKDASVCNMNCQGDTSQVCGGRLALNVFQKSSTSKRRSRHVYKHAHA